MTDESSNPLGDALEEGWREREAAEPAEEGYTGEPCVQCGRVRVFVRRDGQLQCEKCETIQPDAPSAGET